MRSRLAWLAGWLLGVIGALVDPGVARACSCYPATGVHHPAGGATDVPLNTRIWAEGPPGPVTVRLMMGGAEVPVNVGSISWVTGARLVVLTPKAPLAPRTQYVISNPFSTNNTIFTTGDAADSSPPPAPRGRITSACAGATPGSSCGPSYQMISFELEATEAPVVTITGGETPPPPVLDVYPDSWPPPRSFPITFLGARVLGARQSIGRGACMVWPTTDSGGTIFYGALDLSGNFSGWQSGGPVKLPDVPAAGDAGTAANCIEYGDGGAPPDSAGDSAAPVPDAAPVPVDGGVGDAPGVDGPMALPVTVDGGGAAPVPADAGVADGPGVDAGLATADGGGATPAQRDGCSCRLGGRHSDGGVLAMGLVVAGLAWRGRRRRS